MPRAGDVLHDAQFKFRDGATGSKLCVVLNDPQGPEPCLVVKTTSQAKRYQGLAPGCHPHKKVFLLAQSANVFPRDTYIQLEEIFEYDSATVLAGYWAQRIRQINKLPDLSLRQLKNCLKKLRSDISDKHYEMIFRKN